MKGLATYQMKIDNKNQRMDHGKGAARKTGVREVDNNRETNKTKN